MKRALLVFVSVLVLTVAGSALAQTDSQPYDSTGKSATTARDTSSQPAGDSTTTDPNTAPAQQGVTDPPAKDSSATHESMPRTASNLPLVLAIGMGSLGGTVALRLYRLRRA
jgi:hypothetical protein